jgi:hypothetical protein
MDNKKFERLPKWAKDEIFRLMHDVNHWKEKAMSVDEKTSNISYTEGLSPKHYLPKNCNVYFEVKTDKPNYRPHHIEVYIDEKENCLKLFSDWGQLQVRPRASNSIYLEIDER